MKVKNLKLKVKRPMLLFALCSLLSALCFLTGCSGYKFQGRATLPFDSVRIGRIENRTFEPKLEDKLQKTLADELIKNGIMISKNAGHVITGVITKFELKPLTEKDGLAVEYEVIIKGQFFLTSPEGKVTELRNSGVFIVSFYNETSLQALVASKEPAIETALKNLSSEIRAGIVYTPPDKTPVTPPKKEDGKTHNGNI